MKSRKILGFGMAVLMAAAVSFSAMAATDAIYPDFSSDKQVWLTGGGAPIADESRELNVEKYQNGIKVTAIPTAAGDPWKFVLAKYTVDLDKYSTLVFDVEATNGMQYEIKTSKGESLGVPEDEYKIIPQTGDVKRYEVDLQAIAKENGDNNKTGEGEETILLAIAFFPAGGSGAWSGDISIKEMSLVAKEGSAPESKPESQPDSKPESKPESTPDSKPEEKPAESKPGTPATGDAAPVAIMALAAGSLAALGLVAYKSKKSR